MKTSFHIALCNWKRNKNKQTNHRQYFKDCNHCIMHVNRLSGILFLILYYIKKKIDSKLLSICSVIDHRGCQNEVRTKKWHTRHSWLCHWCSYHILTSSVIYYSTDVQQLGIYFFLYNKELKKVLMMMSSIHLSSNRS